MKSNLETSGGSGSVRESVGFYGGATLGVLAGLPNPVVALALGFVGAEVGKRVVRS